MALELDLLSLFSNDRSPSLAGLDIGSSHIKLVELSRNGNHIKLERYGSEILPRGAIVDGHIEHLEQVISTVRRLWKKTGCKAKQVAIGLPATSVITKTLLLPSGLDDEQLRLHIESDASQYIPFPLDEVILDCAVLGPAPGEAGYVEVMMAAARNDKVEDRIAIPQAIGIKPVIVDINNLAAVAALHRARSISPSDTQCLINIGAVHAQVLMVKGKQIIYEREHAFGCQQLTDLITAEYGISPEEAETKKRFGGLPSGYKESILQPFTDTLAAEISRALQFFATSTLDNHVSHILLAGGGALIRSLADDVRQHTQIQTSVVNPFADMQFSRHVRPAQLQTEAAFYLVACGLALRRFDHG